MHVYDAQLEPGGLAVIWTGAEDSAAVYDLAEHEAFALLDSIGAAVGQPDLIAGLSSRMTLLLEPGALVLSPEWAADQLAIARIWRRPGAEATSASVLTAVTDRLQWPVLHDSGAGADAFVAHQQRRRPALDGRWRRVGVELATGAWGTPTRLEVRLGARRVAAA